MYYARSTLYVIGMFHLCNMYQILLSVEPNQTFPEPNLNMARKKLKGT